jgi:hypothetical protein
MDLKDDRRDQIKLSISGNISLSGPSDPIIKKIKEYFQEKNFSFCGEFGKPLCKEAFDNNDSINFTKPIKGC